MKHPMKRTYVFNHMSDKFDPVEQKLYNTAFNDLKSEIQSMSPVKYSDWLISNINGLRKAVIEYCVEDHYCYASSFIFQSEEYKIAFILEYV